MRIGVIGAGWYGCHIALTLQSLGMDVHVFEKHYRPLNEASGNNQFRLHMGFHYARSYVTRLQSRDGFSRFMERYPRLSRGVEKNLYAIPKYDSLIDFLTYKLIMASAGIEFIEEHPENYGLASVSGVISCNERVILTSQARTYFQQGLASRLHLNTPINSIENKSECAYINGMPFDFVIDATWGHLSKPSFSAFYEPTVLLYYKSKIKHPAITLVDGDLCSIYPTEDEGIYTLSSVKHTPAGQFTSSAAARCALDSISGDDISGKRASIESQISAYVPNFRSIFEYQAPQLSIKTKLYGQQDDRSCYVSRQGRVISVMSGKIDTIFFAAQRIVSFLEVINEQRSVNNICQEDHQVLA